MQLDGYSIVEQNGRESALAPRDIVLYDTARPFTVTTNESARSLVMVALTRRKVDFLDVVEKAEAIV